MSNPTPEINFVLGDDKSTVTISINGNPATFTTKEFEHFVGWLGVIRSQMSPIVPVSASDEMSVSPLSHIFLGHRTGMSPIPGESGAIFAARSEAFGWMEFTAGPEFCRGIAEWLSSSSQSGAVEPTSTPS